MLTNSLILLLGTFPATPEAAEWSCPKIPETINLPHPRIAATAVELDRLRAAYADQTGDARRLVAERLREADEAMKRPIEFPPRGGQHNQWYQCDDCQLALRTVDATHHRCPECSKVYSGEPYDDVMYSRKHSANLRAALATAWAYAVTGESPYAEFSAQVLLGYAARYRDYPYHSANRSSTSRSGGHLFEQTLTEASAMTSYIAPAYDLVCASDAISEEQREQLRQGLLIPMLENIAKYRAGKSNWQTWHNAALLVGGAVLGDGAWVRRAITDPGNGFVDQMEISVSADGMWYENSWGYHFYTLRAMIHIVEGARRIGIDLWSHPRLRSMFTVAIDYAMPNSRLPRLGDDVNTSIGSVASSLEYAYHAYRTKELLCYLPSSATWDSVMLGRAANEGLTRPNPVSRVFSSAGHAILRTGGSEGLVSVTTFGPYGGFHGHYDKLSFVLYAQGRELGVDPGRASSQAYRLPIHRNWYKATLSHNTLVADGKSQRPAAGRLLWFEDGPDRAAMAVQCDEAFDGVVCTRLLLQTADYLLVFDDLQSDTEHRYDWFYHNRGELTECNLDTTALESPESEFVGMEYVANARTGLADQSPRIVFSDQGLRNVVTLDAAKGTTFLLGDGVGASVRDRVPLVRVTRHGANQRFAAVLEPCAADASPAVTEVSWRPQEDHLMLEVIRGDEKDVYYVDSKWRVLGGRR